VRGIVILGATGSVGSSVLDVVARHPDRYRVVAVTAQSSVRALADICARFEPALAVIGDPERRAELAAEFRARGLATRAAAGPQALIEAATCDAHTVVAAIVGAAGLMPTLAAARAGRRVLLANKESIVCSGELLFQAARDSGAELLPVDSEHSAIHQCLAGTGDRRRDVRRLILTASGGPFRTRADTTGVTPEQAVAHPNWVMGRKISVDSATLMNKGLEVIEASCLFGFPADRIDVVVHPQSVIHSMVEFGDGSVVAQLGTPDMRTPIAYALAYPERVESGSDRIDFTRLGPLTFESADMVRFPCLALAYQALREGSGACATLNAANEIAVEAFLDRRLAFDAIAGVIEETLVRTPRGGLRSIDDVLDLDRRSRACARELAAAAGTRFGTQAAHT
jgi:1-deoxy-D-xylulose-5-phosphate reductoisomerase